METRIIEFAGLLRRNGIRVSTAETLDALRASELSGLANRAIFKNTLRAAMVKRSADVDIYDGLFDSFFTGLGELARSAADNQGGEMAPMDVQDMLDQLAELMKQMDPGMSELGQALLMQDTGELERILRELLESGQLPEMKSNYVPPGMAQQLSEMAGGGELAGELEQLAQTAEDQGVDEEMLARIKEYLDQRAKDLAAMLKGLLKLDREQGEKQEEREKDRDRLLDKSFYYLNPSEIKRMREAVSALARKLKNVMAVRYKRTRRGRLDVRRTLRDSMEFGGVPFHVRWDDRRRERPQVVILCDVSDSVRNVSRFMLQFVHSLQDMYSRVRSFVFVADLGEVTNLFSENDIQSAINRAINGDVVNVYAHSDFGRAFKQFHRNHLDVIDSRTTVIILGDARNNYNAAHDWVIRDIADRARQVIWLNPENASTWGFGDSEMSAYGAHCDMVRECRNLRQLYAVVDLLVNR